MKNIHLTIIIGLILLVLGVGVGFLLGISEKSEVNIKPTLIPELTAQERKIKMLLKHKTLDSLYANISGEVVEVGENKIIIMREQDKTELEIGLIVHIIRLSPTETGEAPAQETIQLEQIKAGEHVTIYAVITEQGKMKAEAIIASPAN